MSHSTSESVECPLCEEQFDPTAAGGWCTNSDCGEWQYEAAAETVEQTDDKGETGEGETATSETDGGDEPASDRLDSEPSDAEGTESESAESDEVVPEAESDAESDDDAESDSAAESDADAGSDSEAEPAEAGSEPDAGAEASADEAVDAEEAAEPAASDEDDAGEQDLACPSCGNPVAAEHNFCVNCGADVSALEPGPLTECPSCEADVEPEDNFCATCGEDLDAHRAGAPSAANDAGGDTTDSGDADDSGDPDAGAGTADDRSVETATEESDAPAADADSATPAEDAPESLVLVVRNREVQVWDGDTVGRTIRSIVMNTGGDEDDAVRIHREHVKFVREGGQFHLVALGQNPTVVNGDSLDEGDRVPISPGDRIELSDVARMRVEAP